MEKVWRDKLRAAGLRPLEIWVPDLRDPKVRNEIRADATALAAQAYKWDDFWSEMEALQEDLFNSEPIPDYRLPENDASESDTR